MDDGQLRILSGMRPTGRLHLGHYHGALKNWIKLQYQYDCFFMVADLHSLTTNYDETRAIEENIYNTVIDWLACGVDPAQSIIFVQSQVPAHFELYLLLSMITPIGWLERVPTFREQIEKLSHKDIETIGFLAYPLLQAVDVLLYHGKFVPVGEDQVPHVELIREVARRFNYLYGRELGFEEKAREVIKKLGTKKAQLYEDLLTKYQQNGDESALEQAKFMLNDTGILTNGERDRLVAFLENKSKIVLTEPQALLTDTPKLLGLDGQKMSKSYGNTIFLRENIDNITSKINSMQTDPARVRRVDIGNPQKCPVWNLHKVYSNSEIKEYVVKGCTTASIGCLECKKPLIDAINAEQRKFEEQAQVYLEDPNMVKNILADGAQRANEIANATIVEIKKAMNINY